MTSARDLLLTLHDAAIAAALPGPAIRAAVARYLPAPPAGRCVVVGAGKATAAMAAALDDALAEAWGEGVDVSGVVATPHGHAVPAGRIAVVQAGHPVPDADSLSAARRMTAALAGLSADDLVIALVSGGGSACLERPIDGLDLAGIQSLYRAILASGATIGEANIVRRHLSRVKNGRLAQAALPARVVSLLVSDIPGDDPAAIASGPTLVDDTMPADALAIIDRYDLPVPAAAVAAMQAAPACTQRCEHHVIASSRLALTAARSKAQELGLATCILGDALEGEARDVGVMMAGIALSSRRFGDPVAGPAVLLSGGETTVGIRGGAAGKGGRNTEFALAVALALDGAAGIHVLAADSDGIDGSDDAAGAIVTPETLAHARRLGLDARDFLDRHDSYSFFEPIGDLVITGPTRTNVNDIRIVLIERPVADHPG